MRNGLDDLNTLLGQFFRQNFCHIGSKRAVLVNNRGCLDHIARALIEELQIFQGNAGAFVDAGCEPEHIGQTARDNGFSRSDRENLRKIIFGGRL